WSSDVCSSDLGRLASDFHVAEFQIFHGFYIRHAKNLEFSNVEVACEAPDERSAFVVNDVQGADFFRIKTPPESRGRVFSLTNVTDFRTVAAPGVKDAQLDRVEAKAL